MKYFALYLFLFGFACHAALAQMPIFRAHSTREQGDARANLVFQGDRGWLWLGAEAGLLRYDGLVFQPFALPDSLTSRTVSAIGQFNDTIWVGFRNGSIGIAPRSGEFLAEHEGRPGMKGLEMWSPPEGTPAKPITGFARDHNGGFWFSTYGEGLYCRKFGRVFSFDAGDDGLSGDEIYAIAPDAQGQIWAATDNGISICAMPAPGKKQVRRIGLSEGLPDEIVTTLLPDSKGKVWAGTDQAGVALYDLEKQAFVFKTENWNFGPVTCLALYEGIELWIGTSENGLVRLDLKSGRTMLMPDGHTLRQSKIRSLLKDHEGLLWAVTDKGQVLSANCRFAMLETPFPGAQALLVDRSGRLWAGSSAGLFLQENGVFRQVLPGKQNVMSLCESLDGRIWAGTFGNGVFVLDAAGKILKRLTEGDGLANGSILSMACVGQKIWLATLGGVHEINLAASNSIGFERFTHQSELGTSYVYKVFADSRGRIWFGTDGRGLSVLENGRFEHFAEANGLSFKTVYCITEDRQGKIWFSTDREGLFCFDGQNFCRLDRSNGLHGQNITGLATDGNGEIVVAYSEGFDILTPHTLHIAFFDASSGVPTLENNLNALCTDPSGHVWMGTTQDIVRALAFPEKFRIDPQTRLRSVSLFLKPIDFQAVSEFSHDNNYLIFDFTGLWFTNPEAVAYRFKLEGFDPDWKTSKDHLASYPNLPPGSYTFRVQSSEHGQFEGTPEASYTFVIGRPFWAEWWFVLLCLAGVLGLFRFYIQHRDKRLQREAQLKKEKIESQFATLKSQINPHFLFNSFNTLITIIEENPKVAVEYVEHLSDFYRTIMLYREKDLISLQEEMELVRNFSFLLKKRFEDNIQLNARVNGMPGFIMPLTLQMLVENAVKHNIISKSKPLTVEIFVENDGEHVVVRNNVQRKIKPEPSTHFGLQSLVNRYQLLGEKNVQVEETSEFFTVRVPILKNVKEQL